MFQSFETTSSPEHGAGRLASLRELLVAEGLAGFLIPRADAHQGEYVAPRDDRLAWLTGFTGSAGFCAALRDVAGVFVDGRYRVQVKEQVDLAAYTPVDWPEVKLANWLIENLTGGGVVGFDPMLHVASQIEALEAALAPHGITMRRVENLVDRVWPDQPAPPVGAVSVYPEELAGESHTSKRARLGQQLAAKGQEAAVITLPDSLSWLLNIRGTDIPRNPVPHGFGVLHANGHLSLFMDSAKLDDDTRAHLGSEVTLRPPSAFGAGLRSLTGPVRADKGSAPIWVADQLAEAGVEMQWGDDPCILPKARKTDAEVSATRAAHLRDAAAMCEFLCWFDAQAPGTIRETDVVSQLEARRRDTNALLDISFDTIAGTGPHGAVIHYRVTHETDRLLEDGQLIVLDSGGQYQDGTTDITRTLPIGTVGAQEKRCFTRVLQGMIAMSRARFPCGVTGAHLDALARYPLWLDGLDYDHGTGHGVGVNLCVHEGPQRLSRATDVALEPGMILSNEPGYYREGAFGIRIENLIVVQKAAPIAGADARDMLDFETITYVPIDRRLIDVDLLSEPEKQWLNAYHAECRAKVSDRLSAVAKAWLDAATVPI